MISTCRRLSEPNYLIHTQFFITQLKKCSNLLHLQSVHASLIKYNLTQECYLMNQFISSCSSLNLIHYALSSFTQIKSPNVFVYNALIRGLVHDSRPLRAIELYLDMLKIRLCPTSYTFSSLIKGCRDLFYMRFGESMHCHVWKYGFQPHLFVQTALLDFYGIMRRYVDARRVFDEMSVRDVFAWTTMVSVHARDGDMYAAQDLFDKMPERNITTWNTMIDGYRRLGNAVTAKSLFDQMPKKDLISWTTMITCFSHNKQHQEALNMFNDMMQKGVSADEVTVATVISSCAHLGALELGKEIHYYINKQGLDIDVYIGSALIDMYAKCGSLDRSLVVFYKLKEKNLFCWNSIIEGLSIHGHVKNALAIFNKMLKESIMPNKVTFVSVLGACAHAGLVEEGREMFQSMIHSYSILPEIEHYGCMVDLLGRAGLVKDALHIIQSMTVEPNSVIWGALLNGCKLNRNLEVAELCVSKLMVLEPDNYYGYYSLLISMYAGANRWKEVASIRARMKEVGVEKKFPGSSWIEMGMEFHQFAADERSHPASAEIYMLLDEIDGQLKSDRFNDIVTTHVKPMICRAWEGAEICIY